MFNWRPIVLLSIFVFPFHCVYHPRSVQEIHRTLCAKVDLPIARNHDQLCLVIGIGGTSLLARDTKNRIHVVITHIGSLSRDVFRAQCNWEVFLVHCCYNIQNTAGHRQRVSDRNKRKANTTHLKQPLIASLPSFRTFKKKINCQLPQKELLTEWEITEGRNSGDRRNDDGDRTGLAHSSDEGRSPGAFHIVSTTI